jgi:flagellin-specific chaperone FliS
MKNSKDKSSFNDILTSLQKNMIENKKNQANKQPTNDCQQYFEKESTVIKALSEPERNKLIGLLHLYISEFPDKLKLYKEKNFHKMTDKELLNMKEIFKKEVNTSNNLSMAVELSIKLLELYEYVCCDFMQVNIEGISKLEKSQEYKDYIKAVLIKYFDNSLISYVFLNIN